MGPKTLLVHEVTVDLSDKPTVVLWPIASVRARALEIARDPGRSLVLRVEGIAVTGQPGVVYEIQVDGADAGVLSFYGAEEENGQFVAAFPIDDVAGKALREDARELRVTFTPRGTTDATGRETIQLTGRASFSRLRLVEE